MCPIFTCWRCKSYVNTEAIASVSMFSQSACVELMVQAGWALLVWHRSIALFPKCFMEAMNVKTTVNSCALYFCIFYVRMLCIRNLWWIFFFFLRFPVLESHKIKQTLQLYYDCVYLTPQIIIKYPFRPQLETTLHQRMPGRERRWPGWKTVFLKSAWWCWAGGGRGKAWLETPSLAERSSAWSERPSSVWRGRRRWTGGRWRSWTLRAGSLPRTRRSRTNRSSWGGPLSALRAHTPSCSSSLWACSQRWTVPALKSTWPCSASTSGGTPSWCSAGPRCWEQSRSRGISAGRARSLCGWWKSVSGGILSSTTAYLGRTPKWDTCCRRWKRWSPTRGATSTWRRQRRRENLWMRTRIRRRIPRRRRGRGPNKTLALICPTPRRWRPFWMSDEKITAHGWCWQ